MGSEVLQTLGLVGRGGRPACSHATPAASKRPRFDSRGRMGARLAFKYRND